MTSCFHFHSLVERGRARQHCIVSRVVTFFLLLRCEWVIATFRLPKAHRDNRTHSRNVRFHSFSKKHFIATKLFGIGRTRFSGPITLTRTALIRDLFSYGFPRKLLTGPYGSCDKLYVSYFCRCFFSSCRSFKENVHQLQASCNSQNSQLLTAEQDK